MQSTVGTLIVRGERLEGGGGLQVGGAMLQWRVVVEADGVQGYLCVCMHMCVCACACVCVCACACVCVIL